MDPNSFQFKKCIRIVPFSQSVTTHERLSNLPEISLNTLIKLQEKNNSHLPEWISPSLLRQFVKKQQNFPEDIEDSTDENKISRIYMLRNSEIGTEFLLQYDNEKFPFSKWICEKDLLTNQSFPLKLEAFQQESFDFDLLKETVGCSIIAISHRIVEKTRIYLFKVTTLNFIVYFWEPVRDANESYAARVYDYYLRSVPQEFPSIPTDMPTYQSDSLLKFQFEGVKWIIDRWIKKEQFIIGDDIGFGKTIQFLSFLDYINKNSNWHGPFMVITHMDQILKWKQEIESWKNINLYPIIYDGDFDSCLILREFGFPSVDENGNVKDNNLSFNILLISYELYSRDQDKLQNYKWQIVCLDNPIDVAFSRFQLSTFIQLNDSYKVILCDNLANFSIQQIIHVLNFIRPGIKWTNSLFTTIYQERTRQLLESVVLCRTKQVINIENDLINEYLAFVMPTSVQKIMLRLIKLHELSKICHPNDMAEFENLQDNTLAQYVCNHPFLIDGAEEYLSSKIESDKKSQIIGVSAKFLALDRIITAAVGKHIRIALFVQSKQFSSLIEEMLKMNQLNYFAIDDQMSAIEIQSLLKYFNSPSNLDIFIIISSISLNVLDLSSVTIVLILDFNTNTQLPILNTEPLFSKVKIPKKNIFKLITFRTIEHEQYIKQSKERELLSSMIISSPNIKVDDSDNQELIEIDPPDQSTLIDPPLPSDSFDDIIKEFQMAAQIIPASSLASIENSFFKSKTNEQTMNDREFISFVTQESEQPKPSDEKEKEKKSSSAHNLSFKDSEIPEIIQLLKKYGYGSWNDISKKTKGHNSSQIFEFCAIVVILSFRSIQGFLVPEFPILLVQLDMTVPDFTIELLFCSESKLWSSVFYNSHSFNRTLNQIRKSKEFISKEALSLLKVLEMRCIYQIWESNFGLDFLAFSKLPPVKNKKIDHLLFNRLRDKLEIDLDDHGDEESQKMNYRLIEIVQLMKYDLIIEQKFEIRQYFSWWCEGEFRDIMRIFENFGYNLLGDIREFHAKTGILSKNSQEIKRFALGLKSSIFSGKNIFPSVHQMILAPDSVQKLENFGDWSLLNEEDIFSVKFADEFVKCGTFLIQNFEDVYFDVPLNWKKRDFKKLLLLILQFGVTKFDNLFEDPSFALPSREIEESTISIFENISSFLMFMLRIRDEFENCK